MIKVAKARVGAEELAAIEEVFAAGWLGMGNHTLRFEQAVQDYLGARHVVTVNTGTSALHLALLGLGIGAGEGLSRVKESKQLSTERRPGFPRPDQTAAHALNSCALCGSWWWRPSHAPRVEVDGPLSRN